MAKRRPYKVIFSDGGRDRTRSFSTVQAALTVAAQHYLTGAIVSVEHTPGRPDGFWMPALDGTFTYRDVARHYGVEWEVR